MIDLNMFTWGLRKKLGVPTCDGFDGPCNRIGRRRRQSTAYDNDEDNFVHMCDACFSENQDYWDERWSEYYSDVNPNNLDYDYKNQGR